MEIYSRDKEKKFIEDFVRRSIQSKKSSLMYLCGHPGTGKTSTLHLVLSKIKQNLNKDPLYDNIMNNVMLYNAMTFRDVKKFCIKLLTDLTLQLTGQELED